MKKWIGLLITVSLFTFSWAQDIQSPLTKAGHPVARGSFIQNWLVKNWKDADWDREFRALKDAGMELVILQDVLDSKEKKAVYATDLPGYQSLTGKQDVVENLFRFAKKYRMKVILGLNSNGDWWKYYANDTAWLFPEMEIGNQVANELNQKYVIRYPNQFYGWYWWWEIDNLNYKKPEQQANLAKALDISCNHLHKLTPGIPVMICPFWNRTLSTPEEYRNLFKYLFSHSSFGRGDIFCPQDGCGGELLTPDNFMPWFSGIKEAVKSKPGIRYWSDLETFRKNYRAAPVNEIAKQMINVRPYVENIITFSYSHYQSPSVTNPNFHKSYLYYVRNGYTETKIPTPPTELTAKATQGGAQLSWLPSKDDFGILGYIIYKDGVEIANIQPKYLPRTPANTPITYFDKDLSWIGRIFGSTEYQVEAYDFSGNRSMKTPITKIQ